MVEVNWKGIARSMKALGGEGTVILLFKPAGTVTREELDNAIPEEDEGANNGGWSEGPPGWLLLAEGLPSEVNPWIERLAARMDDAGLEGTLTGASTARFPKWAGMWGVPSLNAIIGLAPDGPFTTKPRRWLPSQAMLERALTHGLDHLTGPGGRLVTLVGFDRHSFWTPRPYCQDLMRTEVTQDARATAIIVDDARKRVGTLNLEWSAYTLGWQAPDQPWHETLAELRHTLLTAPTEAITSAMITHRPYTILLYADHPHIDDLARIAFGYRPDVWSRYLLEPNGIQVVTNAHLEAANDLTNWHTTRLDANHVLLEARDLHPWYGHGIKGEDDVDDDLLAQATHDFGDMILTAQRVEELDLPASWRVPL